MRPLRTKQEVLASVLEHRQRLRTLGVSQFGLFGSFQREAAGESSDVNVLVVSDPEWKTFRNFMDLCFFLEELFGRKVDVVTLESLSPHFGEKILRKVEYVAIASDYLCHILDETGYSLTTSPVAV